jgi:UDP-3-O-[3-hydroxymyristoyl] glucosamine N-acyltransferase
MEDIRLNSTVYLVGAGGASKEIELELSKFRNDLIIKRVVIEGEYTNKNIILESDILSVKKITYVIISLGDAYLREKIYSLYSINPYIIFPNVIFSKHEGVNMLGFGNIIMPNVVFTSGINIGNFNYFNYNSFIAHDCVIGEFNTISPNSVVNGSCNLSHMNFLGSSVTLNPEVNLNNVIVSSGTVVRKGSYSNVIIAQDFGKIYKKR